MGVPKFFRYMSERYPCLSEVVREYQIPEFDNMYLDMNGIIHMCSHPDDNNPHFRITEEKIFQDIFHYLEVLFRMIRPQKLFFMAVDGVAPRAKMNQQRGRRFRAAKEAIKQEEEAKKRGEELPKEARFDSNCITPGTPFMAKLQEQLKYFVVDKISNDPLWRQCKIILSGQETPGEGEHKIMDYIRYIRSQPGYDPNTRHCLYGLDADLIMLGLCTHEPHFSLLREEVKFGKKSTKRQSVPEEITFFLLHLSLMREYLELEFSPVRDKLKHFEYNFEKVIDDWILMGFLVGNDFIPHLPNLHIADGALPILYKAYMEVLPTLDGYINEAGTLNLQRFEKFMQKLSDIDLENFEEIRDDMLFMEAKTGRKYKHGRSHQNGDSDTDLIEFEFDDDVKPTDSGLEALIKNTEEMYLESSEDDAADDDEDHAFEYYKKEYYRNKLAYTNVTPEVMRSQAEGYVRAIQWNLHYYYNGVCSWSWYYPHHYSPYISDIKGFKDLQLDFDLGTPFLPYEQLLGVLPSTSKSLLPEAYHTLMTGEESLIKKYYPENFETDLNGKKQEWEAVVLIPFMDENLLLEAMRSCNEKLTPEEKARNKHGPMLVYTFTHEDLGKYEAPAYFPEVRRNHAKLQTLSIDDIKVPRDKLIKGVYPGAKMDVYYPGFPTMKHLDYKAGLMKAKVKVFEQPSRNESMIIQIISEEKEEDDVPTEWLGTSVFVGWPHLVEARVQAISNVKKKWINMGGPHHYNIENRKEKQNTFKEEAAGIIERYQNRMGIQVGDVEVLVHVQVMTGRKYIFAPNGRLTLEKQFSELTANYPVQTVVANIVSYDSHHTTFRDVSDVFPEGSDCFTLSNPYYGSQGIVLESRDTLSKNGRLKVLISVPDEPEFNYAKNLQAEIIRSYKTLYHLAGALGMSNHLFSRVTGSIFVMTRNREGEMKSVNIGLDLKFNKKNKETPGYTRKIGNTWYYTDKVADLVSDYTEKFPAVFKFFCRNDSYENIMADDIFGKDESDDKIKEIQQWLKSLPTHSVEKQICGSQAAEPEVVKEIEGIVDKYLGRKTINSKKVTMQIKPSLLYKPEIQSSTLVPDPKMTVQLFDRIVNVRIGFSVPFALKGTVTAICQSPTGSDRDTMYEVLFDVAFKDGMALNCSEGRAYRLPKTAFINITYGKRLVDEKTGGGPTGNYMTSIDSGGKPQLDGKPLDPVWRKNYNNQYSANRPQHQNNPEPSPYINLQEYHESFKPYPYKPNFTQPSSAFAQFANVMGQTPSPPNPNWKIPDLLKREPKKREQGNRGTNTDFLPDFVKVPQEDKVYSQNTCDTLKNKDMLHLVPEPVRKQQKEKKIIPNNAPNSTNTKQPKEETASQPDTNIQKSENSLLNLLKKNHNVKCEKEDKKENYRPMTVDTNFLKTILKIGENSNQKRTANKPEKTESQPERSSDESNSSSQLTTNVSFETLAKAAQAPASVRLLTYYQSNELGVPRYQYIQSGNLFKAQIALTDGQVVLGEAGETKEKATENVASQVLGMLINKAKSSTPNPSHPAFPSPPKTWVQQKTDKRTNVKNPKGKDSKQNFKEINHPFVPLQAVKSQRRTSSNSQSESTPKNDVNSSEYSQQSGNKTESKHNKEANSMVTNKNKSSNDKPRGQRRPRIAAKFVNLS